MPLKPWIGKEPVATYERPTESTYVYGATTVGTDYATYNPREGYLCKVRAIYAQLITSAVVINRYPRLITYDYKLNPLVWMNFYTTAQPASVTRDYWFVPNFRIAAWANFLREIEVGILPECAPNNNIAFSFRIDNIQAGDTFSFVCLVDEWPDPK